MAYKLTRVWEIYKTNKIPNTPELAIRWQSFQKQYGSKKSGTIYALGDDPIEAVHAFLGLVKHDHGLDLSSDYFHGRTTFQVYRLICGPRS
jgi:hypothetical protein